MSIRRDARLAKREFLTDRQVGDIRQAITAAEWACSVDYKPLAETIGNLARHYGVRIGTIVHVAVGA